MNERILLAIANECSHSPELVEIGCGTGNLTKQLLNLNLKVHGIEFDRNLYEVLSEIQENNGNFTFEMNDATTMDYEQGKVYVGNLPYNVGSRILLKCVKNKVQRMVFLLQKEVVDRITSKPGNPDYGSLSVLVQTYYECKAKLLIGPENFRPRPKVNSKLLICQRRLGNEFPNYDAISKILRISFNSNRKTLRNTLGKWWPDAPVDLEKRPGQISVEEYSELAKDIERIMIN